MLLTGCVSSLSAQQSFWKEDFSARRLDDCRFDEIGKV
jgi:alpha-glucosidase